MGKTGHPRLLRNQKRRVLVKGGRGSKHTLRDEKEQAVGLRVAGNRVV